MGADGWEYFAPYQPDIEAALQSHQRSKSVLSESRRFDVDNHRAWAGGIHRQSAMAAHGGPRWRAPQSSA